MTIGWYADGVENKIWYLVGDNMVFRSKTADLTDL